MFCTYYSVYSIGRTNKYGTGLSLCSLPATSQLWQLVRLLISRSFMNRSTLSPESVVYPFSDERQDK